MHARIIIPDLSPQHAARRDAQDRLGFQGRWFGSMCSNKAEYRTSRLCHRMLIPMTTMMAFLHAKVTTTYHHHPQTRQKGEDPGTRSHQRHQGMIREMG